MIKQGYKVVNINLQSALGLYGKILYRVGESVTPRKGCGPLTVFKSIEGAVRFKRQMIPPLRIFKCFYIPSAASAVWVKGGSVYDYLPLEDLIKNNSDILLPDSVDLADEVILTEEL